MNEYDLIRRIAAHFPRHARPGNTLFGCDAEIVEIGGQPWGLTIDEFTPEEDHFTLEDPARLGRNLAIATISDLLAAGVAPRFFLSSLALPRTVDLAFADGLASGIASAVAEAGCIHCGGDLGAADPWRFTGFAMGPVAGAQALTRRVPEGAQSLCVTGALGDLNLAVFRGQPTPALELRLKEAEWIRTHASACIDTSGGFFDALWLLHQQSPGVRFRVNRQAIPLAAGVRAFSQTQGIPPEAVLLGGAGEYELLFTVPAGVMAETGPLFAAAGITVVGDAAAGEAGIVIRDNGRDRRMERPPPCPREAGSVKEHADAVIRMAGELLS
jgi:thiamine-monophosphate kinase